MNQRPIAADTGGLIKLNNVYEALDYLAKANFKYYDLSLYWEGALDSIGIREDFEQEALKVKKYADALSLKCNQTHSFFTSGVDKESIYKRKQIISQDIKVSKIVGAKYTVVHPIWELSFEENAQFFRYFIPLLNELDMKIAIENVWGVKDDVPSVMVSSNAENILKLLNLINDDHFVVCLDIGHAEMSTLGTSAIDIIKKLGNKIELLHIHDNDLHYDLHQIPFTNKIDFTNIFKQLKTVGYKGDITFEVERCYSTFPKELYLPLLNLMKEIGNYFSHILDD